MDKVKGQFDVAHDPLQRYRLYARGYGFVVVALLIIAAGVPAAGAGVSGVLALLSGVYLGRLWVWGGALREKGRGLPHGVTAIRGAAASAIFASSAVLHIYGVFLGDGERWVILGIFTLVESTDLIDGILARRLGGGRPGEGKGAGEGGELGGGGGAGDAEGGSGVGSGAPGRGRPEPGGPPGSGGGAGDSARFGIWNAMLPSCSPFPRPRGCGRGCLPRFCASEECGTPTLRCWTGLSVWRTRLGSTCTSPNPPPPPPLLPCSSP